MYDPLYPAKGKIRLKEIDPDDTGKFLHKSEAIREIEEHLTELFDLHYLMFADNRRSLLVVFQGIDASGKDGAIRHLASGLNPQGVKIHSFNRPSLKELDQDYLWRIHKAVPPRGEVGIFNRSHYEEVTTVKVHRELLSFQQLPPEIERLNNLFKQRHRQINDFERMLSENGTRIVKFFLHISPDEQEKRLQQRLNDPKKNWKYSEQDLIERTFWNKYMQVYEKTIELTNTSFAPWYIIPANYKWYRNYLIGKILVRTLQGLDMQFPTRNKDE